MYKKVNEEFSNYSSFALHYEPVDILQVAQNLFWICPEGAANPESAYIQGGSKEYVNGWLYGAVQAACGQVQRLDKTLRVRTPEGTLVASASGYTAEGYPGIDIVLRKANGEEFNLVLVEHIPGGESACGYDSENPAENVAKLNEVPLERRMKGESDTLVCTPGLVTRVWNTYKTLGTEEHVRLLHPDLGEKRKAGE